MPLWVANDNNLKCKNVVNELDKSPITDAEIYAVIADWTSDKVLSTMIKNVTTAEPAVVETYEPHGLETGDNILITRVLGTLSVNGRGNVTVIDETHFSVDGSNTTVDALEYEGGGKVWRTVTGIDTIHLQYFPTISMYVGELDKSASLLPGNQYLIFFYATNYDFQSESRQQAKTRV